MLNRLQMHVEPDVEPVSPEQSNMSQLPHHLLNELNALTPAQLAELESWVGHRCGDQSLAGDDIGLMQELASENDAGQVNGRFDGDEIWIDWLRRPFDGICHDDLEPITDLYRSAVDRRSINRLRFGAT